MAMLSPLGGFTENELAAVRTNGDGRFCELVLNDSNEKVVRFRERTDRYRNMRATCTAGEIANAIVAENGYFNYAYAHGDDCAELLDKFWSILLRSEIKTCIRRSIRWQSRRRAPIKGKSATR